MSDAQVSVRLQPRASRNEIVGLRDGVLVVRVDGVDPVALGAALAVDS